MVPSISFKRACCTPSPDTSLVIEGLSDFLEILSKTESYLSDRTGEKFTAGDVANNIQENEENTFHALNHLSSNRDDISVEIGESPEADRFVRGKS